MRPPLSAFALFLLLLGCAGCSTPAPLACPPSSGDRQVRVFFATDRKRDPAGPLGFGGKRSSPTNVTTGWETVSIEPKHRLGKVDTAVAAAPNAATTASLSTIDSPSLRRTDAQIEAFAEKTLRPALHMTNLAPNRKREVLLYIHGFNDSFGEAIRKAAQFSGDLGLTPCVGNSCGVALVYSWPAEGKILGYLADEESAEWTQQRLEPFLRATARVCREEGAELNIIAHSMGARLLTRSLAEIANTCARERGPGKLANQVVLLAPDVSKEIFDQYVERILPLIEHLTIYVSAQDHALTLSSFLHGGYHRLGLVESSILAALKLTGLTPDTHRELGYFAGGPNKQIDMIDVTGSIAGSFGHSYEDPAFIQDLRELLERGTPAGTGGRSNFEYHELQPSSFSGATGERLRYFRLKRASQNPL